MRSLTLVVIDSLLGCELSNEDSEVSSVGGIYPSVFYDTVFVGDNLLEFWLTLGKGVLKKLEELEWDHEHLNHELENSIKVNHAMRAKNN